MTTHRAWVCTELREDFAGLQLQAQPDLPCPPGHARVRVHAAALNFPDMLLAQGKYQHRPELPFVAGMESAGKVIEIGSGVKWPAVGDSVCFGAHAGAFSEELLAPAAALRPLPAGFSLAEGAAYGVAALTAWVALVRRGALQRAETLLVHGAGGGTGLAAVELGRHLGASVIASASAAHKLDAARAAGATHTLRVAPGAKGLSDAVKALTGGHGADVIFDPVGGEVFDASLHCIAWGGRLLVVGFASGRIGNLPANLPLIKGFAVIGVRAGEYGRRDPERGLQNRQAVEALAAQGLFRPHIGARFALEQLAEAYRAMATRRVAGKIVIDVGG
jgi:NADPH2:quinone reductase